VAFAFATPVGIVQHALYTAIDRYTWHAYNFGHGTKGPRDLPAYRPLSTHTHRYCRRGAGRERHDSHSFGLVAHSLHIPHLLKQVTALPFISCKGLLVATFRHQATKHTSSEHMTPLFLCYRHLRRCKAKKKAKKAAFPQCPVAKAPVDAAGVLAAWHS